MFDMAKDERLTRINHRAGMIAFYGMWVTTFALLVLGQVFENDPFTDPKFTLIIPWMVGTVSYVALVWRGGVYAAVREESTNTPRKLLEARVRMTISIVLFAAIMFFFKRFDIFDHDSATLAEDVISTLVVSAAWGATMWFLMARKGKRKNGSED